MAQELKQTEKKETHKLDKIILNILSNEGTNIKIKIKLTWTILQLKEHLYDRDYFKHEPFNQIISLHGTDLQNTQTFEQIYNAIKNNKDSKGVLRSLRGQLTWEDNNLNVDDITNNDNNININMNNISDTSSIPEILLYIRAKIKTKKRLATLRSNEPILEEFIQSQNSSESISLKSAHSDSSSSSSSGRYGGVIFSPDAIRKKQEKKALKQLTKVTKDIDINTNTNTKTPQTTQLLLLNTDSNSSHSSHSSHSQPHKPSGSVIFHQSNDSSSNTYSSSSSSSSTHSKRSPEPIDPDEKKSEYKSRRKSQRKSLYADISKANINYNSQDQDKQQQQQQQSELTQANLYMHTHARHSSSASGSGISSSFASIDWGGGPFIVKRMSIGSIGSVGSGMPTNLGFYHATNQSAHLWELDLPDYYDNIPDSLQRIHHQLDNKHVHVKKHRSATMDVMDDVDEDKELICTPAPDHELKDKSSPSSSMHVARKSVRFSQNVVYKSDDNDNDDDNKTDLEEKVLEPNVDKWKVKQVGVDSKYVEINKDGSIRRQESQESKDNYNDDEENNNENNNADSSGDDDIDDGKSVDDGKSDDKNNMNDTDSSSSHSTSRSNGIYDIEQIAEDKMRAQLTWKTSYFGIFLIGMVWMSSFHCLYSFSAIVDDIIKTLNTKLFEFGLMYAFNFIGVGIGLLFSSYLLNKAKWINSSQTFAKWSIFIIFITQFIATMIFLYEYAIDSDESPDALLWIILVLSRFIMGIAIGFNESSVNNLVFEWFSDDAFNAKISANNTNEKQKQLQYLHTLSSRVLPYCLFLKESGHISARLVLVPLIFLTFSKDTNLFVPLLFGVVLSGLSWCGMVYASYRDRKNNTNYHKVHDDDISMDDARPQRKSKRISDVDDDATSDNDSESTPLLHGHGAGGDRMMANINIMQIPDDWSYGDWYDMELIGLNKSVILSIIFLSINFGVSFSFTILSISNIVQQYMYTDYTANLLICLIPLSALFGSNWLRRHVLSKVNSVWTVMFMGCILYVIVFGLFAFAGLSGVSSVWLPIICVIIFILGSECLFASGYELLLSSSPEYIHGLISGVNSSVNFIISGLCILIFSLLVIDYSATSLNIINQYRWAYAFCCFASLINLIIAIILRDSFGSNVQEL